MVDGSITINTKIDQSGFNAGRKNIESGLSQIKSSLSGLASAIGIAFGTAAVVSFGKEAVNTANELSNAMQGLQSIVEGQGRSFERAQSFINDYVSDGLVPLANATTAYKNLAARGYSDDQIQKVMVALKDSAAFGRQASYSLGDAVTTATEGLKNENSILVDNAGVTKNVAKMWEDYAKSIGTTRDKLTQEQKIQAEVNGILTETRFQTGDAAKIAGTYSGQVSKLSYHFTELKTAIGNSIIPILQSIMPYIDSAIQGLTRLFNTFGQFMSSIFGTQTEQISSGTEKAAQSQNNLASATDNVTESTKKSTKAAKDNLAAFDELNIRQKDTSSGDSGSSGNTSNSSSNSGGGDITTNKSGNSKGQINTKLLRTLEKIKKATVDLWNVLKKFSPLLKGIGAAFGVAFAISWISGFVKKFTTISIVSSIIMAIKKALVAAALSFKLTKNPLYAVAAGFESLWKSFKGYMSSLSTMQKVVVSVVALTAVFVTAKNAFKDYAMGTKSIGEALLNLIPVCAAVGVVMYAMFPEKAVLAVLAVAITAVAGALMGVSEAEQEIQKQRVEEYFSGVKVTAEDLSGVLAPMTDQYTALNEAMENHKSKSEEIMQDYNDTSTTLDTLFARLEVGKETIPNSVDEIYNGLLSLADGLKTSTENDTQYYYSLWAETFKQTGTLTESESVGILQRVSKLGDDKKNYITEIENKITEIHDQAKQRNVGKTVAYTKEELAKLKGFQDNLDELMSIERNKELEKSKLESVQLYDDIKSGRKQLNNETYEEIISDIETKEQEAVKAAQTQRDEGLTSAKADLETAKILYKDNSSKLAQAEKDFQTKVTQVQEQYSKSITDASDIANATKMVLKEKLDEDNKALHNAKDKIDEYNEALKDMKIKQADVNTNVDKSVEGQKKAREELQKAKDKVKALSKELDNNKDVEKNWLGQYVEANKGVREETDKMIEAVDKSIKNSISKFESYGVASADDLRKGMQSKYNDVKSTSEELGKYLTEGVASGVDNNKKKAADAIGKTTDDMEQTFRKKTDTHSPSKVYQKFGEYLMQGLIKGINDTKQSALNAFTGLFNTILSKAETFSDRFRAGMNKTIGGFTNSMNGIRVDASGIIRYTNMPKVYIPRLATGAVIPPNSEFLAVLGDQRKGRNLEAPESLIRKIVREESGGGDNREVVAAINNLTNVLINKKLIDSPESFAREFNPYFESEKRRSGNFAVGGFVN